MNQVHEVSDSWLCLQGLQKKVTTPMMDQLPQLVGGSRIGGLGLGGGFPFTLYKSQGSNVETTKTLIQTANQGLPEWNPHGKKHNHKRTHIHQHSAAALGGSFGTYYTKKPERSSKSNALSGLSTKHSLHKAEAKIHQS